MSLSEPVCRGGLACQLVLAPCLVLLLTAAPPRSCARLPAPGEWFHLAAKNAPQPSAREPDPVPVRAPFVMASRDGLLVLTPHEGGRYDLCSNTWKRVGPVVERATTYGLPAPLVSERELFFIGPANTDEPFGFFARFELATSKWKAFPQKGAPAPRYEHLQAWAGDRLLILLGRDGPGGGAKPLEDGAVFDPATNQWTPMSRPPHTVAFEAAVPLDGKVFIWPHGFLYDVRADKWTQASRAGMSQPYQAALVPKAGALFAIGGNWVEGNVARYVLATDAWQKAPPLKLEGPTTKSHHLVNGVPVLVVHPPPNQGLPAGPGATLYPGGVCGASTHRLHWLADDQWRSTAPAGDACWLTLVTPDAVFFLRWPRADAAGKVLDGEARAFDPRSGSWRRASIPAKGWPGSWGDVRWDGRAFWQWTAFTTVSHAVDGQCQNTPANSGCDPVVTTTLQRVDEGWRLEPVWEDVPG